jgi:hypothetical protein
MKLLSVVAATCLLILTACQEKRHPNRFLIPQGYSGWIKTIYNAKDASLLPRDGEYLIHKFPDSGVISTATFCETGWALDEFYFYTKNNSLEKIDPENMIHLQGNSMQYESNGQITNVEARFFVGTNEQLQNTTSPQ